MSELGEDVELVAIAKIVKPRGVKGETVAGVLTDFPDRFEKLRDVIAVLPKGGRAKLKIENFWFQNDRVILKFEGIDSIDAAEELRDAEICIPESEAVELSEGEFFDWQLIGCRVETIDGETVGTVRELIRTGGTEILAVDGEGKEILIPFAESICVDVDIAAKSIKIDPPEGLLEF